MGTFQPFTCGQLDVRWLHPVRHLRRHCFQILMRMMHESNSSVAWEDGSS